MVEGLVRRTALGLASFLMAAVAVAAAAPDKPTVPAADALGPEQTVQRYLEALRRFDPDSMDAIWSEDAVSELPGGKTRPIARGQMRTMRGFEREMNTRWSWTILGVEDDAVRVREVEENDLYDAIGSGACTQTVVYTVAGGHIVRMASRDVAYSGRPFREAVRDFETWLLSTPAGSDPVLLRDGRLRYTPESGQRLHPWLRIWRKRGNGGDNPREEER